MINDIQTINVILRSMDALSRMQAERRSRSRVPDAIEPLDAFLERTKDTWREDIRKAVLDMRSAESALG